MGPEQGALAMGTKPIKKQEPRELLLVQSKVKDYIRSKDLMCASDLIDSLNEEVYALLDKAGHRTLENGRKTARGSDV